VNNASETPVLVSVADALETPLIQSAAEKLLAQDILVIPTDTVYGIAQIVSPATSPAGLMQIKQRPQEKNIPLLVSSIQDLERYGSNLPDYAKELAARHWPGALTLVVRASQEIPHSFVGEDGSVALRMPAHPVTLALLKAIKAPLACSSANLSGKAPATALSELDPLIAHRVALIIDGGSLSGGVASTVVSCLGDEPLVLRPGPVAL
jgi:tRNA threonylcarbamoyl adenosine modification protein (Sua5/YciO/YrdC/YwlC family)